MPAEVPTVTLDRWDELPDHAVVLDVREDDEWSAGHIAGAVHVPMNQVPSRAAYGPAELGSGRPIVCVCKVGGRSAQVTAWLIRNGYEAVNLAGGMHAWAGANRPMVSEDGAPPRVA
jgi:rhodanese-related sulfurtransferase